MEVKDIFKILEEKEATEKKLHELTQQYYTELKNYLSEYFKGEIPRHLPLNKNQFITINKNKSFTLYKGDSGKISWTANGSLVTVKDGIITNGHAQKTLFQGQYEALPLNLRHNTPENAAQLTQPVFPLIAKLYNGNEFGAPAYLLAENTDLGIMLIWRKSGVSYIDRMTHSLGTESGLELLAKKGSSKMVMKVNEFLEKPYLDEKLKKVLETFVRVGCTYTNVTQGGKLSEKIIIEHTNFIEDLFGVGTTDNIVSNIKGQKEKLKNLKDQPVGIKAEETKPIKEPKPPEEMIMNGIKYKI